MTPIFILQLICCTITGMLGLHIAMASLQGDGRKGATRHLGGCFVDQWSYSAYITSCR